MRVLRIWRNRWSFVILSLQNICSKIIALFFICIGSDLLLFLLFIEIKTLLRFDFDILPILFLEKFNLRWKNIILGTISLGKCFHLSDSVSLTERKQINIIIRSVFLPFSNYRSIFSSFLWISVLFSFSLSFSCFTMT